MPQKSSILSERKIEVVESYLRGELGASKKQREATGTADCVKTPRIG